ncbi:MAG: Flp family type IVb pilin [candidate division Zixibacteria bacterium]|nr:Flp family type IVb pilin [candidate division Zixibacteria bacterium]
MFKKFMRNEEGQDVIEWGMLAAFLSVLLIVAVTTISPIIGGWYTSVTAAVQAAP